MCEIYINLYVSSIQNHFSNHNKVLSKTDRTGFHFRRRTWKRRKRYGKEDRGPPSR